MSRSKSFRINSFIRIVVAFVAAMLLFAAVARGQALTTTPVVVGEGHVDYDGDYGVFAGWAVQTARLSEPTRIRVYKGSGGGPPVWEDSTRWSRKDINDWKGEGINHFHFEIPVALCSGAEVSVRLVGVTDEGDEFPLGNGEFKLTCAAPPPIFGEVRNVRGMPVMADGLGAYLTLYRMDEEGIAQPIAYTDCERGIGCADAQGRFSFRPSDLGFRFVSGGVYQVRAGAGWHHEDTQEVVYWADQGGAFSYHQLRLQEVLVGVSSTSYKFLSGAASEAMITVCNFGIGGGNPFVGFDVITRGPGKNSGYVERTTEYGFFLPLVGEPCYEFSWSVGVSVDLPNGQWYNFGVRFKNRSRKDEVYGEGSWSAAKVAFMTAIPLGDTAMRSTDAKPAGIPWALLGINR